jgi:hypothetical protein
VGGSYNLITRLLKNTVECPAMRSQHFLTVMIVALATQHAHAQHFNPKRDADPPKPNFGPKPENRPVSEAGTGLATPPIENPAPASPPAPEKFIKTIEWGFYLQPQVLTIVTNADASLNAGGGGAIPIGFRNLGGSGALPPGVSPNDVTARADGTTTNTTVFRMRRSRLRFTFNPSKVARAYLELDGTPVGTGSTFIRQALATGIARLSDDVTCEFSGGIARLPMTLELLESSRMRPFMERSVGIRMFWPGDSDIGAFVRANALKNSLQMHFGVVNGVTLFYPTIVQLPDFDRSKDAFVNGVYTTGPVTATIGFYGGRGQVIDAGVLRSFARHTLNLGASFKRTFSETLGETRISTELKIAHNMDRGFVYPFAAPKAIIGNLGTENRNGRAFYFRAEQELTPHALVAVRYDTYVPNVNVENNSYHGLGVVAAARFGPSATLGFEYLYAKDSAHEAGTPAPDRQFHVLSSYFQVRYDP